MQAGANRAQEKCIKFVWGGGERRAREKVTTEKIHKGAVVSRGMMRR
jgi:hypothetical protein